MKSEGGGGERKWGQALVSVSKEMKCLQYFPVDKFIKAFLELCSPNIADINNL